MSKLTEIVKKSTYALVVLKIFVFGLIAALLLVLPWLLRLPPAGLADWRLLAVMAIQVTYSAFSNSSEVLASSLRPSPRWLPSH